MSAIPQVIKHHKDDGVFVREFNNGLNSTIHKVQHFILTNPKTTFLTGLALGGTLGFLAGIQTGTIIGLALGKFFSKFA